MTGFALDLLRSPEELQAENALLRRQLIIARRFVKSPKLRPLDRAILVAVASLTRTWQSAVLLVKPETVLRWHRTGFRLLWRRKSRPRGRPPLDPKLVAVIRRMARENFLWGAERIRGELLELGFPLSKRTVQRYMRGARPPRPPGQSWRTFIENHAPTIWACDFVQTFDVFFRPIFALVFVALGSRAVVHLGVTYHPTDTWVAQQLREATPFGEAPRFLIRDNDDKYGGGQFERLSAACGIRVLRTPVRAPKANAFCERFIGSARRECLDRILVLNQATLRACWGSTCASSTPTGPTRGSANAFPLKATSLCLLVARWTPSACTRARFSAVFIMPMRCADEFVARTGVTPPACGVFRLG